MKDLCSSLLILLFLLPAISTRDDQICLADFFLNANPADQAIVAHHISDTGDSCILATFLDQLDHAQAGSVFILTRETTSNFRNSAVPAGFSDRHVTVPSERAPPFRPPA